MSTVNFKCQLMFQFKFTPDTKNVSRLLAQLEHISRSARADFLIRLDDRYGSEPIIKARQIIHELYLQSKAIKRKGDATELIHRNYIAERINEYADDPNKHNEYVYLLNLMDFLETICFFANRGDIHHRDISDLMGLSLDFFYDIFKIRIDARSKKYKDRYYSEFETLIKNKKSGK